MAINRRGFLKTAAAGALFPLSATTQTSSIKRVAIVREHPTAAFAALARTLSARGVQVREYQSRTPAPDADLAILARVQPGIPESFLVESPRKGLLTVTGGDARGLTYALLEL